MSLAVEIAVEVEVPPLPPLPKGVLVVRPGPGANCSSAGSAIDVLFYGSVLVGAVAVALAAAFPPRGDEDDPSSAGAEASSSPSGSSGPSSGSSARAPETDSSSTDR